MARTLPVPVIIGFGAAGLMGLGAFLPLIHLPIVGTVNYFHNARGDGSVLLALAVVCAIGFFLRSYWLSLLGSGLAAIMFGVDMWDMMTRLSETKEKMSSTLADNPFRGFAESLAESMQIDVGAYVIGLGILLAIVSSLWGDRVGEKIYEGGERSQEPIIRTVEDRLREIEDLLERGILTPEEYKERRAAIVKEL